MQGKSDRPFGYLGEKGDRTLGKKGDRTLGKKGARPFSYLGKRASALWENKGDRSLIPNKERSAALCQLPVAVKL
ncbi:hypothetical protein [Microcoleus sp. B9-D4]|uniref:hypothetical protein n=1 Tax=Microcoleus sp. B9-D4 TaxID=2818711 RepID=UPI002FD40173